MKSIKSMVVVSITDERGTILDKFIAASFKYGDVELAAWIRDRAQLNVDFSGNTKQDVEEQHAEYLANC